MKMVLICHTVRLLFILMVSHESVMGIPLFCVEYRKDLRLEQNTLYNVHYIIYICICRRKDDRKE